MPVPIEIDGSTTFWFPGLYDTILFSKGQLKKMTRYVLSFLDGKLTISGQNLADFTQVK